MIDTVKKFCYGHKVLYSVSAGEVVARTDSVDKINKFGTVHIALSKFRSTLVESFFSVAVIYKVLAVIVSYTAFVAEEIYIHFVFVDILRPCAVEGYTYVVFCTHKSRYKVVDIVCTVSFG